MDFAALLAGILQLFNLITQAIPTILFLVGFIQTWLGY